VSFHARTGEFYRQEIELPFFKHFLKDGPDPGLPEAYVFETGTCQWRRYDSWPPGGVRERALHFGPGGTLSFDAPPGEAGAFDEYVSDPARPVPFIPDIAIGMTEEHMLDDQRFASARPDVLVYRTEVLEEDVTIAGPIKAHLAVSTTGTDADWVVKLIDVWPSEYPDNPRMGGYQQMIAADIFRGRYREDFSQAKAIEPNRVLEYAIRLPQASHTFLPGHRIMVQVQSSWFPLYDRNPQTFVPNILFAPPESYVKATHRIWRTSGQASAIELPVIE
jgi:putative CocE/NonD family hydrolase